MFKALSGKVKETMIMELNRESGAEVIKPFTSNQNLLINEISKFKIDAWKEVEREIRKIELKELGKEARLSVTSTIISACVKQ